MFYDVAIPVLYRRIKTNNLASLLERANEDYDDEDSDDEDSDDEDTENDDSEDEDSEDEDSEDEDSEDEDSEDEDTGNEDPGNEDAEAEDEAPDYRPPEFRLQSKLEKLAYTTHLHLCPWEDEEPLAIKVMREGCWEEVGETPKQRQKRMEEEYSSQNVEVTEALERLETGYGPAIQPFPNVQSIVLGQAGDRGHRNMELGVDMMQDLVGEPIEWLDEVKDRVTEFVMNTKAPHICVYSFHGPFALGGIYPIQRERGETIVTIHQHILDPHTDIPMPQLGAVNRVNFQPGVGFSIGYVVPTLAAMPSRLRQMATEVDSMSSLDKTNVQWYGACRPSDTFSVRLRGQTSDDLERIRLDEYTSALHEKIPVTWRQKVQMGLRQDAPLCPACGLY